MNDILKAIFESYEKEKEKIRKRIDANKNTINKLDAEINNLFIGCESIMQRVNVRKENKPTITELEKKLANVYEAEIILNTALKVANEMKVKVVANALKNEILASPEKWSKYPLHYQKFKDMIKDFLKDTELYFYNHFNYGNCYISGSYEYSNINSYIFYAPEGIINEKTIEDMKTNQEYPIISASDILTECKKAFAARKKILEKYENARKEIENLRTPFSSCNTFYNILPYANSTMENYKSF